MTYSNPVPAPTYPGAGRPSPRPSYIPHPKEYANQGKGPFWGSLAAQLGGALIFLEGTVVGFDGATLPSWLYRVLFSLPPAEEGWLMVLFGLGIIGLGWLSYYAPSEDRWDGAWIWILLFVLGLTTLVSAGFYVGSLLVGYGAHAIFWWRPKSVGGPEGIRRASRAG